MFNMFIFRKYHLAFVLLFFSFFAVQARGDVTYKYEYKDRPHTFGENVRYVSILYALNWGGYYFSQPRAFSHEGSWKGYKGRFGKIVFDMDSSYWNQVIHPYVGSQVFLFYRSQSYSRMSSFFMTAIQSTLFEFTIEAYTEPASAQDLYQTPVLGSLLGIFLEESSLYLLKSSNVFSRGLGHLINPMTLFPFFEGKTQMTPMVEKNKIVGLNLGMEF